MAEAGRGAGLCGLLARARGGRGTGAMFPILPGTGRGTSEAGGGAGSDGHGLQSRGTTGDRKSVVSGQSVSVRVDLGGRRSLRKKNQTISNIPKRKHSQNKRTSQHS